MTEIAKTFIRNTLAEAKAAALDWLDERLSGQWHEIAASKTEDGKFKIVVRMSA